MEVECPNFTFSAIQPPLLLSVLMDLCGDSPVCLHFWQMGWKALPGLTFLSGNRHEASKEAAIELDFIPVLPLFFKPFEKKPKNKLLSSTPNYFNINESNASQL